MIKEYIVIAFTENQIGVLNRITALYLRRKINIESLKVSESSIKGISMFVISAFTTQEVIDKLAKQLRNIVEVIQVEYYSLCRRSVHGLCGGAVLCAPYAGVRAGLFHDLFQVPQFQRDDAAHLAARCVVLCRA